MPNKRRHCIINSCNYEFQNMVWYYTYFVKPTLRIHYEITKRKYIWISFYANVLSMYYETDCCLQWGNTTSSIIAHMVTKRIKVFRICQSQCVPMLCIDMSMVLMLCRVPPHALLIGDISKAHGIHIYCIHIFYMIHMYLHAHITPLISIHNWGRVWMKYTHFPKIASPRSKRRNGINTVIGYCWPAIFFRTR